MSLSSFSVALAALAIPSQAANHDTNWAPELDPTCIVVAEGDTVTFPEIAVGHNVHTVADHAAWTDCTLTDAVEVATAGSGYVWTAGSTSAHFVCTVGCSAGQKLMVMVGGTCPSSDGDDDGDGDSPSDGPSDGDMDPVTACFEECDGLQTVVSSPSTWRMDWVCSDAGAPLACAMQGLMNADHACAGTGPGGLGFYRGLCEEATRTPLMQGSLTDAAACVAACPDTISVFGAYTLAQTTQNMRLGRFPPAGRRLAGHGQDLIERHAMLRSLCPNREVVDCFTDNATHGGACDPTEAAGGPVTRPQVMDWCNVSMSVAVTMELTVDDPAAFVANTDSVTAVAAGIAAAAGSSVADEDVEVELSVARRLMEDLSGSGVRRLEGAVNVDATILRGSTEDVTTLQTLVAGISPADMATGLNAALTQAGINETVSGVASLTAEPAAPADGPVSSDGNSNGASSGPTSEDPASSSGSVMATVVSSLLVASIGQVLAL